MEHRPHLAGGLERQNQPERSQPPLPGHGSPGSARIGAEQGGRGDVESELIRWFIMTLMDCLDGAVCHHCRKVWWIFQLDLEIHCLLEGLVLLERQQILDRLIIALLHIGWGRERQ